MSLENSTTAFDQGQIKNLLPGFLNKIGLDLGLTTIDMPQPLSTFIADIGLRDSLALDSNLNQESLNINELEIPSMIDHLVAISSSDDDKFKKIYQEIKQFYLTLSKQAHSSEQISAIKELKTLFDKYLLDFYKDYNEKLVKQQEEIRKKYIDEYIKSLDLKRQQETRNIFYKQISDAIEYQVVGVQSVLNSLEHYHSTLKFMLLIFDKGSMAYMSTTGMIDSLNMTLPAFRGDLANLQSYHSDVLRTIAKGSA